MIDLIEAVFGVVALVMVGVALAWRGLIAAEHQKALMSCVLQVFLPCLIVVSLLRSELLDKSPQVVWSALGAGAGICALSLSLVWLLSRCSWAERLGLNVESKKRTFTLVVSVQNYGYMVIPLIKAIAPDNADLLAILFLHNVGLELVMWTLGMKILGADSMPAKKLFTQGPVIAIVLGLGLLFTGAKAWLPDLLWKTGTALGHCAVPLALMLIGAAFYEFRTGVIAGLKKKWRLVSLGVLFRLLILPLAIVAVAYYLPLIQELKTILYVQACMPCALTPILLAKHYRGDAQLAIEIVLATSALAIITIPFILTIIL